VNTETCIRLLETLFIFAKDTLKMILPYKETTIFYTDTGLGDPVVLLHGFLENHTMWHDISEELIKTHRVIAIDLLGHGNTGCIGNIHLMSDMAEAINTVISHLEIKKLVLVGHSMGGYVALSYAEKNVKKIKGLCLMNSTYEADDDERKKIRARANEMVDGNFTNMVRMSLVNLFSEDTGMRLRKDFTSFFVNAPFRKALILGKKDAVLDSESISEFAENHHIYNTVLAEGHMSHIENKHECKKAIVHFVEKIRPFSEN